MRGGLALLAAFGILVVAGCAQVPVPQDHFYRLVVSAPAHRLERPLMPGTLVVNRFLADGLLSERAVVYMTAGAPNELEQYHYRYWSDPPTRLLQDLTIDYLRAAGVAREVVSPAMRARADYTLTGKLKRLELVRGAHPRAVVAVELGIERERDGRLVWLKGYEASRPVASDDVVALAAALGHALDDIFGKVVADLSEVQRTRGTL